MVERRLRPGMDRHELAAEVADLLVTAEGSVCGLTGVGPVGEALFEGARVDHGVRDPFDNGRRITGQATRGFDGQILQGTLYFRSRDKMDVDSVYQEVRKRLRAHGSPSREQSQQLVLAWQTPKGRLAMSRYRDDDGMAVLHLSIHGLSRG